MRDAANGAEFRQRVERATGHAVRLLSGREEADLIGRGLLTDAALAGLRDFYVYDLGGGSLECLAFRDRRAVQVTSLPLGCVRLMEQCVTDPRAPLAAPELARITAAVREVLAKSGFILSLPPDAPAVFTGGTVTTVRAIAAAQSGAPIADTRPLISAAALRGLLEEVAALGLAERRAIRGLAPARADVFPTALAIALAVADAGGFTEFRHSFHNLRYGVAAEALGL